MQPLIMPICKKTQAFKLGMFKKIIWNQKNMEERIDKLPKRLHARD
jgi:hypothetical protein